ncbi:MAG TPA: type II secretion system protein GspD [Prochlorococcus sp.]
MSRSQRLVPLLAALGLCGMSIAEGLVMPRPVKARMQGVMELKLRRSQDSIEVIIEGVGLQPVLQQQRSGQSWEGRLRTQGTPGLRRGPQQVSMPELGLQSVSLSGSGESYQLKVEGVAGRPLLDPVVSADGRNLILSFPGLAGPTVQTGRLDLQTPGRVPQAAYVPPLRQRAVAPPLGDMAVGTMVLSNRSFVQVSGPPVTLTLNNAPAKDALMSLARLGGYGFIFVGDDSQPGTSTAVETSATAPANSGGKKVSMAFQNESYARALNGVLLASGLQGKLDGRTLLVGSAVASKTFGPQVSKIYRLNQASASSAADYLASLGASISKVNVVSITSGEASSAGTSQLSNQVSQTSSKTTSIETYGSSVGPLKGLSGTTDSRLQTITLVGDSKLVSVAESYLKQIDLRQRQVALSVKILDVNLDNDSEIDNSFSLRFGNNLIVNDQGRLLAAFGRNLPADAGSFTSAPVETETESSSGSTTTTWNQGYDYGYIYELDDNGMSTGKIQRDDEGKPEKADGLQFDNFGNLLTNGGRGAILFDVVSDSSEESSNSSEDKGTETTTRNPSLNYPDQVFYDFLKAQILSKSTKILASPTLILSENAESIDSSSDDVGRSRANEALVAVGSQVIVKCEKNEDSNGNISYESIRETAGLTLGARVQKIDDNGFVTFTIEPNISAAIGVPTDVSNCGSVFTLYERRLETGSVRLRDGQTLILAGVIQDEDKQVVTKWPILGDIPFIGQFFRKTQGARVNRELVIMVSARIIDDNVGGTYGYGYRPSTAAARQLIYSQGRLK